MKTFKQFVEQAAVAPTPQPVEKTVAKATPKPKVTDPSAGVDKDSYGRWKGDVVNLGQELEPEKTEVTPGKKGPDADLPAGSANPNKRKRDDELVASNPKGPMPLYVRDSIMRQYGKPGYGRFTPEDQKNIINWNKLKQA